MKARLIGVCAAFVMAVIGNVAFGYTYFESLDLAYLNRTIPNLETAKKIAGQGGSDARTEFELGLFYLFNVYEALDSLKNERGMTGKIETQEAIRHLKKAYEFDSKSSLVTAIYGSAIIYSARWGTPISQMRNGKTGVFYLNLAKELDPDYIPTLYTRIQSMINLPPRYFAGVDDFLLEDTQFLIETLSPKNDLDAYDAQALDTAYFYRAKVLFGQKKPRGEVEQLLDKVRVDSPLATAVRDWKEKKLK